MASTAPTKQPVKRLEPHPLANLLPMMSPSDLSALEADILSTGRIRDTIVLYEGKILDGRNRHAIAIKHNLPFKTRDFIADKEGSPVQFVYSQAVRRNMTDSQKAAAAVSIQEALEKDTKARKVANLKQNAPADVAKMPLRKLIDGKTRQEMAEVLKQNAKGSAAELKRKYRLHVLGDENAKASEYPSAFKMAEQILDKLYGQEFPPTREEMRRNLLTMAQADIVRDYGKLSGIKLIDLGVTPKLTLIETILQKLYGQESPTTGRSRDQAASLFGVSPRYVQDAKTLKNESPKLFEQVFEGKLTISRAKADWNRERRTKELLRQAKAAARQATASAAPSWEIRHGDCLEVLQKLGTASASLVFTDPPYNIGLDYGDGIEADAQPAEKYLAWCESWLRECQRILTSDGSLFVMISGEYSDQFGAILRKLGLHRRQTIVWHETFGNYTDANFTDCARFIHYYTTTPTCVWHADAIRIPSDRQTKYADARAVTAGKVPSNVWTFPRLVGNAAERLEGFPTQLPRDLVERIIRVASNPGDLVIDPFSGTGTTGHACLAAGRRYLGIEAVKRNVEFSRLRLQAAAAQIAPEKKTA